MAAWSPARSACRSSRGGPYAARVGDRLVQSAPATYVAATIVFGELRDDPALGGWTWVWGGYVGCDQPWVRSLCRA